MEPDAPSLTRPDLSAHLRRRREELRAIMRRRRVDLFLSKSPATQTYFSGFQARNHSRPILLVEGQHDAALIVPRLEEVNAQQTAEVDRLIVYDEQPDTDAGIDSPTAGLQLILETAGPSARVGVEFHDCDLALADSVTSRGSAIADLGPVVAAMRSIKDAGEIDLLNRAARLTEVGVRGSLAACAEGITELAVDAAGNLEVLTAAAGLPWLRRLDQATMSPSGVERTVLPHTFSTARQLELGDGLIHTRHAGIDGYRAELERTVVLGRASTAQRAAFAAMCDARDAALEQARAGVRCCDVDAAARERLARAGLSRFIRHRTGHGIGLSTHEPPFLRYDNMGPLEEGMVITIEPGLYVDGLGGFRHSDTLVVGADGPRLLTAFPTALDELIVG